MTLMHNRFHAFMQNSQPVTNFWQSDTSEIEYDQQRDEYYIRNREGT